MAEVAAKQMYDDGFEARRGPPTASDYPLVAAADREERP